MILQTKPERIDWVDAAKGIGILLVIIGHSMNFFPLRGAIFSFHMPLFFICSGFTFSFSNSTVVWWKKIRKALLKTVILAFGLYIVRILLMSVKGVLLGNTTDSSVAEMIGAIFYSSGVAVNDKIPAIGAVWFLVSLFFCRGIMDFVHLFAGKHDAFIAVALCLIGIIFGRICWLPFSLDITYAAAIFFVVGYKYKDKINGVLERRSISVLMVSVVIWAVTLLLTVLLTGKHLELASRDYPLFPICFATAIAGCIACFAGVIQLKKFPKFYKVVCFIGRQSILLYGIHYMTALLGDVGLFRLPIDLTFFGILVHIRGEYAKRIRR